MPAFIFDLDGTLVDTVYQHVLAWHLALREGGFDVPFWRIHRKIGMSGSLLMDALEVEVGTAIDQAAAKRMKAVHTKEMERLRDTVRVFDGVDRLFETLRRSKIAFAIATSGHMDDVGAFIEMLPVDDMPIVTGDDAPNAKPDPQLFLEAAKKMRVRPEETIVVGDSVWDMLAARRAHALGVGLLTGGYAESELTAAGAYRVYPEPADFCRRLHEVGVNVKE